MGAWLGDEGRSGTGVRGVVGSGIWIAEGGVGRVVVGAGVDGQESFGAVSRGQAAGQGQPSAVIWLSSVMLSCLSLGKGHVWECQASGFGLLW